VSDEQAETAESRLITAFAEFVRSTPGAETATTASPEPLLTIADAARYLNVSTTSVRNLAVGGKVRSTRVGDRIRFRREWLDIWIDSGGGDVPLPTPSPTPAAPRAVAEPRPAPVIRTTGRRGPKPKPPTYVQRIGDHELRLLGEHTQGRFPRVHRRHVGDRGAVCGATGRLEARLDRSPHALMCPTCLTALAAMPEAELSKFGVDHVFMMRSTQRGGSATAIRSGYHTGDRRRTLCGRRDGPWALTERQPSRTECFVCDHRKRWDARDLDPNILVPRPLAPLRVLVDAGSIDPRLLVLFERHPRSLDARQSADALTKETTWNMGSWTAVHRAANPVAPFLGSGVRATSNPTGWPMYTISDRLGIGCLTTDQALERLDDGAGQIERATALYATWDKERGRSDRRERRNAAAASEPRLRPPHLWKRSSPSRT
jgi:excisionase family DNA binding protein